MFNPTDRLPRRAAQMASRVLWDIVELAAISGGLLFLLVVVVAAVG